MPAVPMQRLVVGIVSALGTALLTALASTVLRAQPLFDDAAGSAEARALELIDAAESEGGPQNEALIGPLMALGLIYEESGRTARAAAVVERAWQIVRITYGLYSFEQAPMVLQRIEQERARGDLGAAWNLEQALLILARRNPNDLRTVAVLREAGDRRLAALDDYFDGGFPPEIYLGCYYQTDDCTSGSRGIAIQSLLAEANLHYSNAVKTLIANDRYASSELREIETKMVRYIFMYGSIYGDGRDYLLGRESLRRIAAYEAAAQSEPERIAALVRVADWDLVFARSGKQRDTALEIYRDAYRTLEANGLTALIAKLFAPELPVTLPDFMPNWVASEGTGFNGHIDVRFNVTADGKARDIEFLETSANVMRSARQDLTQKIQRSRFRPRVVDGQLADSASVTVRYYVAE